MPRRGGCCGAQVLDGTAAAMPPESSLREGSQYFASDEDGGTLYQVVDGTWTVVAAAAGSTGEKRLGSNESNGTLSYSNATTSVTTIGLSVTFNVVNPDRDVHVWSRIFASFNSTVSFHFAYLDLYLDGVAQAAARIGVLPFPSLGAINTPSLTPQLTSLTLSGLSAGSHTADLRGSLSVAGDSMVAARSTLTPWFMYVDEVAA